MTRSVTAISLLAASLTALTGCVIESSDHHHYEEPPPAPVNYTPYVDWAQAGCYWDDYNGDFVWYFEAEVFDDNGWSDLSSVYADVYDAQDNWIDSFELYPSVDDPALWWSDWLQYSTYLDCYYGGYVVDIVAYDYYEAWDAISVYPETYY